MISLKGKQSMIGFCFGQHSSLTSKSWASFFKLQSVSILAVECKKHTLRVYVWQQSNFELN